MNAVCPYCDGDAGRRVPAIGALIAAIESDDIDAAIELGLLQFELQTDSIAPCPRCRAAVDRLIAVRDARRAALAARERHRRRDARFAQRAEARAAKRIDAPTGGIASAPALPPAAAAALARAKAKAAGRA